MKLQKRQHNLLKSLLMASLLFIVGSAFLILNMSFTNPWSVLGSSNLAYIIAGIIIWVLLYFQVSRATVIPDIITMRKKQVVHHKRSAVWSFMSHGLAVGFVVWFLVIMLVALVSPNHVVVNQFDYYGEYWVELVLVFFAVMIICKGFIEHLHQFRESASDEEQVSQQKATEVLE